MARANAPYRSANAAFWERLDRRGAERFCRHLRRGSFSACRVVLNIATATRYCGASRRHNDLAGSVPAGRQCGGAVSTRHRSAYHFALGQDLVDRACLRVGESVLDVACGTGVVTRLAALRSGNGRVVGLDLNSDMLRVARGVAHADVMSIDWCEGSALALPFEEDAFAIVLCQLVSSSFRTNPSHCTRWRAFSRSEGGSSLVCSPLSSGPPLRMFSRTPSTGASANPPRAQSVPSTPSRIQIAWRNLLLTQA